MFYHPTLKLPRRVARKKIQGSKRVTLNRQIYLVVKL